MDLQQELNALHRGVTNEAVSRFIDQAGNAFIELNATLGNLPQKTAEKWNRVLQEIIEAASKS